MCSVTPKNSERFSSSVAPRWQSRALGLRVRSREVGEVGDLAPTFEVMHRASTQAVLVRNGWWLVPNRLVIGELARDNRLVLASDWYYLALAGGLLSYRWDDDEMLAKAATLVDKILKGAKPADLPVEKPSRFRLALNLKTAKALGLTIPPSVLARADEIIQ